ncbi:MAG: hypothetical protein PVJ76_02170 [Gemmatimonadota bacterium]|jgi:hypothetical protein
MKKLTLSVLSLLLLGGTMAAQPDPGPATPEDLVIQVSPRTIVIGRDTDAGNVWLTIHAEIPYYTVESVGLVDAEGNEFELSYTKDDNRGELVAKFDYDQFKRLEPGEAILTLSVLDEFGVEHVGSETITVMVKK